MKDEKEKKLKPVIFIKGHYNYNQADTFKQNLLLQAMQVTTNPKELKKMIGVRTVAEVYRTLDKMAIRKEYHEALARNEIDLDFIAGGLKELCLTGENGAIRLNSYKTLIKSLGLEDYREVVGDNTKGWEDLLRKQIEGDDDEVKEIEYPAEYEVVEPETPKEEQELINKERLMGASLYE